MLILRKIAITGSLSSGKSAASQIFKDLGAYVVSADEIVHHLLSSDAAIAQQIVDLLGIDVLSENKLDRKKIAAKVFSDPKTLQALEQILHPAVSEEIEKHYKRVKNETKYCLFVAEIPLLYESESEQFYDTVVTVTADENLCLQRFLQKTDYSEEEFYRRVARQLPAKKKSAKSDYLIENDGNLEQLKEKISKLKSRLLSDEPRRHHARNSRTKKR